MFPSTSEETLLSLCFCDGEISEQEISDFVKEKSSLSKGSAGPGFYEWRQPSLRCLVDRKKQARLTAAFVVLMVKTLLIGC